MIGRWKAQWTTEREASLVCPKAMLMASFYYEGKNINAMIDVQSTVASLAQY